MALRGRRINDFLELWCLVASRGLHFCVSSTSFQKNYIPRPQQPLTEKVLKFNMIFHDSTKKTNILQDMKIKLNSNAWMTLKSSVMIFQAINVCSLNDLSGLNSLNDLDSLISSKNLLILMIWSSLAPK